ncbi:MAG: class II aldolase/adducin family protein [Salinivirgaceae bacterium]|nr:class II aldolase/adducin family protein [Salinivirgaceae bacterium]MDD4747558.1 class II aldolase/adducin family protein [Salinivirgaceae bacterium]
MFIQHKKHRTIVAETMQRLYNRGLTTTSGGNVSMRVNDLVFITPSQTDKGKIKHREIGILTIDGKNRTPALKPSMESEMHLEIYRKRPDIKSIVHAHPFTASTLAAEESLIETDIAGEARAVLGNPQFAPYCTMGTKELAEVVSNKALKSNVVIMQHHGVITMGESMLQAFDRLEVLEMTARTMVIRRILNITQKISPEDIQIIDDMFGIK